MRVKIVLSIVILAFGLLAATEVQGQVITSVVRSGGASGDRAPIGAYTGTTPPMATQSGGLKDGNYYFSDRTFTWTNIPNVTIGPLNKPLIGAEYVRTFNSDKGNAATVQYAVTIGEMATVFVVVDNRFADLQAQVDAITDKIGLAGTFKDTNVDVFINESASDPQRPLSVFAAQLGAGTYIFDGPTSGDNNFYVIGAVPGDPTFNPAPAVDAGPDQAIYMGQSTQLAGIVTDKGPQEGDPGVLSWYWRQVSGPGPVTFSPADTTGVLDPTVTFSGKGVYQLMLQATDGDKDANDVMTVLVKDRADEFLVGYWNFEDNVQDQSINNNHGTIVSLGGGGTYDPDAAVGAKSINLIDMIIGDGDPNTNYVDLDAAPELDFGVGDWTVAAWVKSSQANTGNIFSNGGDDGGGIRYVLCLNDGTLALITDDDVTKTQVNSGSGLNDGRWHFVAGQRAGGRTRIYVDGIAAGTASLPAGYDLSGTSQAHSYIGVGISASATHPSRVNEKHLDGLVDDVRVYNYALALDDEPQYDSIRSLTAMGPIVAQVSAGPDIEFKWRTGRKLAISGAVTDYGRPSDKLVMWDTQSGPNGATATFEPSDSLTTEVGFPGGGVYVLELSVYDDEVWVRDTVRVTVIAPTCADVKVDGRIRKMDLDADCYVGLSDLAILVSNWLECNDPEDLNNCRWAWD